MFEPLIVAMMNGWSIQYFCEVMLTLATAHHLFSILQLWLLHLDHRWISLQLVIMD